MAFYFRLFFLLIIYAPPSFAQHRVNAKLEGKVIKILDGDTFDLLVGQETIRIRLNAIDAPEKKQDFASRSKQALADLCFGKLVVVAALGHDRYRRTIGDVYNGNLYVNARMISTGMAWHFKKYSSDESLAALETMARERKEGLWSLPDPVAPWDYRESRKKHRLIN